MGTCHRSIIHVPGTSFVWQWTNVWKEFTVIWDNLSPYVTDHGLWAAGGGDLAPSDRLQCPRNYRHHQLGHVWDRDLYDSGRWGTSGPPRLLWMLRHDERGQMHSGICKYIRMIHGDSMSYINKKNIPSKYHHLLQTLKQNEPLALWVIKLPCSVFEAAKCMREGDVVTRKSGDKDHVSSYSSGNGALKHVNWSNGDIRYLPARTKAVSAFAWLQDWLSPPLLEREREKSAFYCYLQDQPLADQ